MWVDFMTATGVQIEDTVLTNGDASGSRTQTGLLVHYDADGNVVRTLQVTGPRYTRVSGIVPMPGGELYVAGFARGGRAGPDQIILGMDTLAIRPGQNKAFLAKYASLTTAREGNHERPVNRLQIAHYPNPFVGVATIAYELPKTSQVVLRVYDILGRELAVLVNERQDTGLHSAHLDASRLAEWRLPVPPGGRQSGRHGPAGAPEIDCGNAAAGRRILPLRTLPKQFPEHLLTSLSRWNLTCRKIP